MRFRLIRNGMLATSQVLWTTAAMFVVYRMVTHRFGLSLLGLWSSAAALSALVSLGDGGLSDIMVRQIAEAVGRDDWNKARGLHRALSRYSFLGLAAAAGVAAPLIHLALIGVVPPPLRAAFWAIVAGAVCASLLTTTTTAQFGVLEACGRYGTRLCIALAAGTVTILASLWLVGSDEPAAVAVVFMSGAACSSSAAYVAGRILLARRSSSALRVPAAEVKRILRISLPIRMAGVLNLGVDPVTRAALAHFAGVEAAGLYEIAFRVVFQLRMAMVSGLQTLVPHLARKGLGRSLESTGTVLAAAGIAIGVGAPIFGLAVIGIPAVSIVVTGSSNSAVAWYATILATAWMINIASAPGYFANVVEGRVHRNWISHAVICAVNAVLAPSFAYLWGAIGVCLGTGTAVALGSVVSLVYRGRETGQILRRLTMGDYVALFGGAAAVITVDLAWGAGMSGTGLLLFESAVGLAYVLAVSPAIVSRARQFLPARSPAI